MRYRIVKRLGLWLLLTPYNDRLFWEKSFEDAVRRMDLHASDNITSSLFHV